MEAIKNSIYKLVASKKISPTDAVEILTQIQEHERHQKDDVAVIGIAGRFPGAKNVEEYWENIRSGVNCCREPSAQRKRDFQRQAPGAYQYRGGGYLDEIDKFDAGFFRLSPKEAQYMDPLQRLMLETAWEAIEDSGYGGNKISGSKTGVYIGRDMSFPSIYLRWNDTEPLSITGRLSGILASRISYILNLKGPSLVIDCACSSATVSIHLACTALKDKECDMAIAGGIHIDYFSFVDNYAPFEMIESSDKKIRAFDRNASGTLWSEGVGAVLLKPLKKAIEDRDAIHAIIRGSAINNDGASNGISAPNAKAIEEVTVKAWEDAKVNPENVSYIEAHGTGTMLGDTIEVKGISEAFGRYTKKRQICGIGSVKTNIGHTIAASGMASLIKVILALKKGEIPPTINFNRPNRHIQFHRSPIYINDMLNQWDSKQHPRVAGVNSLGFSGTNCHIVLEEASNINFECDVNEEKKTRALTLSARNKKVLLELLERYRSFLDKNTQLNLADVCYTASTGKGHYACRLAILLESMDEMKEKIDQLIRTGLSSCEIPRVFYGEHKVVSNIKKQKFEKEITEDKKRQLDKSAKDKIIQLLDAGENNGEKLSELCTLYTEGADIQWEEIYRKEKRRRVNLPVYPLERKRFWFDITQDIKPNVANSYYETIWVPEELTGKTVNINDGTVVVFKDEKGLGDKLIDKLRSYGRNVIEVEAGEVYKKLCEGTYISGNTESDYFALFRDIKSEGVSDIFHMSTITCNDKIGSLDDINSVQQKGIYSLLYITKALVGNGFDNKIDILLVSEFANQVTKTEDNINSLNAAFFGLGKVIRQERYNLKCRCIDIDKVTCVPSILAELVSGSEAYQVAYRNGRRYVEELKEAPIDNFTKKDLEIKEDGVYIITGGLGGLGLEVGKYLVSRNKVKLALFSRSGLPERERWKDILAYSGDEKLCKKIRAVEEMETAGATVVCLKVNVSDSDEVSLSLSDLRQKYGRINGVIHSAGIGSYGPICEKDAARFREALSPKIEGTWLLYENTKNDVLDFFVMFSSIASVFGFTGQGDYVAANSYLDSFARFGRVNGKNTVTINWSTWKETGMAVDSGANFDWAFRTLSTVDAIRAFDDVLSRDIKRIIVGELNFDNEMYYGGYSPAVRLSESITAKIEEYRLKLDDKSKIDLSVLAANVKLKGRTNNSYSDTETMVAQIWSVVLGLTEFDIYDNFYELGGDSLQGIKIANIINEKLSATVNVVDIFEHLTIVDFSQFLDTNFLNTKPDESNRIANSPNYGNKEKHLLSSAQSRMWFLQKYDPQMSAYNLSLISYIDTELNISILNKAANTLIERHSSLRTSFMEEEGIPYQVILDKFEVKIDFLDLSDKNNNELLLKELIKKQSVLPFDFSVPPLRIKLYKLHDTRYCFFVHVHHIITDGWSMNIFSEELMNTYKAYLDNDKIDKAPLRLQYIDWVKQQNDWIKSEEAGRMERYWLDELKKPLPVLNLPVDFTRPIYQTYNGNYINFIISNDMTEKLKSISRLENLTLHMTMLSLYFVLLHEISHDCDIVVGCPITGRDRLDLEGIMGLFINMLCMRVDFSNIKTFRDLMLVVKEKSLLAYKNSKYPFDLLVSRLNPERDPSRSPLFSTMFQLYENIPRYNEGMSQYDISMQCRETDNCIEARVEYNSDLFRKETVIRFWGYFENILKHICEDYKKSITSISILSQSEENKILSRFSNTDCPYSSSMPIHKLFERQVDKSPDSIALIFGSEMLTYRDLNQKANQLAGLLLEEGVKPNEPVAIMMSRGVGMIAGIIGILKAGAAYVPIDKGYPAARVNYMLEHSAASILVTESGLLSDAVKLTIRNDQLKTVIDLTGDTQEILVKDKKIHNSRIICRYSKENPDLVTDTGNLIYIMYTSGSTGVPKGVMVTHSNVANFIRWGIDNSALGPQDKMMLVTSISFDISVFEIFGALLSGASLVIASEDELMDTGSLLRCIESNKINIWHSVPTLMVQMLSVLKNSAKASEISKQIRRIMIGGEAWSSKLAKEIRNEFPTARIADMYGPTEATIWVTSYEIGEELDPLAVLPIGRPVANNRILILDSNMHLCGIGLPGDIYISGANVTLGYYKDDEKTNEVFITYGDSKERIYKTGDMGKYLEDGNIEYLGRNDGMVKVRGYRVEIGEVEAAIMAETGIQEVAIVAKKMADTNQLICYYKASDKMAVGRLKSSLPGKLPNYMLPSRYVEVEGFPLTSNAKIDRKALASVEVLERPQTENEYVEPSNEVEKYLVTLWQELLNTNKIGIYDNFFSLGGNSFLVNQMHAKIESSYAGKVKIVDIFKYPSISALSKYISEGEAEQLANSEPRDVKEIDNIITSMLDDIKNGNMSVEDMLQNIKKMEVYNE